MSDADDLRALMEADRWIDRIVAQRNHLPESAELATIEEELRALLKALKEAQSAQAPVQTAYDEVQHEAQRLATRANELQKTLAVSMANARELTALQHELDHVRELLSRAEDRELDLLLALEPLDEAVESIKVRAQPLVERRTSLQSTVGALQATLDEEVASLRADRVVRAERLAPPLRARYESALTRIGTSGAAQVDAGRCDGCRIALSPLDFDRWKVMPSSTFMDCPECGRLLLP